MRSTALTGRSFLERIASYRRDNRVGPTPWLSYLSGKVNAVSAVGERSMESEKWRRDWARAGILGWPARQRVVNGTVRRTGAVGRRSTCDGTRPGSQSTRAKSAVSSPWTRRGTQLLTALLIAPTDSRQKLIDRNVELTGERSRVGL